MARFGALLDQIAADSFAWEDVSPVLQRRRKPAGGYEYRPNPARGQGAPGVGVVGEDPREKSLREARERLKMSRPETLSETVIEQLKPRVATGIVSLPEVASGAQGIAEKLNPGMRPRRPGPPGTSPQELLNPRNLYPDDVREVVEAVYAKREAAAQDLARRMTEAGFSPEASAAADTGLELAATTAGDITNVLPGIGLLGAARRLPAGLAPDAALSREAALARQLPETPLVAPRTRGAETLARAMGKEEIGEPGASGRRDYVTLDEDGDLHFDWRRQGHSFPPDLDPWIRGKGLDPDRMGHREKLDLYGEMNAEERAAQLRDFGRVDPVPAALPELTRERWQELRAMNASAGTAYRETNLTEALQAVPGQGDPGIGIGRQPVRYFATTPELALGQGKNKGVLLEFEGLGGLRRDRSKPAAAGLEPGVAELVGEPSAADLQRTLRRIEIDKSADHYGPDLARFSEIIVPRLRESGWRIVDTPERLVAERGNLPASRLAAGNRLVEEGLASPSEVGALRIGPDPVRADPATEAYRASVFREEPARPSIPDRIRGAKDRLLVEFASASDPYVARMAKAGAGEEAEILAHELRRAGHTALTPITYSTRRWDPATRQWEFTGAPFEKLSAQMDEATQRQVEAVMVAQSQVEFAGREALAYQKRLAEAGAEGAGVEPTSFARTKEARDYLAQMQAAGELDRLRPHLEALRDFEDRSVLQPLVRIGVLSEEAANEIRRTNQYHAAMMIAEERLGPELRSGESLGAKGSPLKRREAGLMEDEQYVPTFEAMAIQAARIDRLQVRQLVRNDLAERALAAPELWGEIRPAKAGEMAGTFPYWKDGKEIRIKAPGDLLDVIDNIRPEQASLVWKMARTSRNILQTMATLAPHFPEFNFMRDQPTAAVFSESKKLFGFVPYYEPAKVLFQEIASRMTGKGATKAWKDFQASAAGHSTFLRADREGMARAMEEARLRATPQGRRTLLAREAINPLFVPATVGNALESATRIAERNILLKEGAGAREATRGAAKVSLDFSDGGRFTKKVNEVVAFFNVRFLDSARFMREIRRRPFTIAARATAFITLPALAEEWFHRDDPGYHNLPLWDQAAFYHVGRSTEGFSEGWHRRIPRPLGLVSYVFGLLPQLALRQAIKEDPHAAELAMRGLLQDTPAGLMFAQNEQGGIQPSMEWVPTIGKGAADLVANRKWTGAPVVGDERLPAREQWTDRTSPLVREMAHAMPEAAPDFLQSPQQLEHLISQQTAGAGRLALDLLNPATRAATGEREPPREPPSPRDVPIVRNFMSAPPIGFESLPVEDLYRFTDRADALADQLRRFEGTDRDRAKDLRARYPKVADAAAVGAAAREQMGIWRKERERIKAQQIPDKLKRARLRALDMRVTAYAERQMKEWRKRYPDLLQ